MGRSSGLDLDTVDFDTVDFDSVGPDFDTVGFDSVGLDFDTVRFDTSVPDFDTVGFDTSGPDFDTVGDSFVEGCDGAKAACEKTYKSLSCYTFLENDRMGSPHEQICISLHICKSHYSRRNKIHSFFFLQ